MHVLSEIVAGNEVAASMFATGLDLIAKSGRKGAQIPDFLIRELNKVYEPHIVGPRAMVVMEVVRLLSVVAKLPAAGGF